MSVVRMLGVVLSFLMNREGMEDKHKAPSLPLRHPLSLQITGGILH